MLVKRNMQIPMDFECFGMARWRSFPEKKVLHGILGSKQGLRRSPKSCTRKEHESATNSIAKRGQGGDFVPFRLPLAGSRDSGPCGVWGNAPTVPRATSMPNALNKGAGSEASLPVTLRVRRRAPQAALPPSFREKPKKHPLRIGKRVRPAAGNQSSGLTSVILSVFSQNRACDVSIGTLLSRLP